MIVSEKPNGIIHVILTEDEKYYLQVVIEAAQNEEIGDLPSMIEFILGYAIGHASNNLQGYISMQPIQKREDRQYDSKRKTKRYNSRDLNRR